MIRRVLGSASSMAGPLGVGGAAAVPWYLSGGISAANCACAYAPKGAASYAASLLNLNAPGTNDAYAGVAPSWDAVNGWTFNGTNQYLKTGVRLYQPYSVLIAITSAASPSSTDYVLGIVSTFPSTIVYQVLAEAAASTKFGNGTTSSSAVTAPTGKLGIAGAKAYKNGADLGLTLGVAWAYDPNPAGGCFIASRNFGGSPNGYAEIVVTSFAIYNTTITPAQVAAVHSAMP